MLKRHEVQVLRIMPRSARTVVPLVRFDFCASRLKYSRWAEVTLVSDERVETLVRTLVHRSVRCT